MRKQNIFALSIVTLFVVGLYLYFGNGKAPVAENPERKEVQTVVQAQEKSEAHRPHSDGDHMNARMTPRLPARSISSISSSEVKSLRGTLPDQADVKKETGASPHQTPESLVNFAKALGPLMEKALKNHDDANLLVKELEDCAMDETVAHTARALCVSNAEKLAKAHPEMKAKADDLRATVSPDVKELLDKKNVLLKK